MFLLGNIINALASGGFLFVILGLIVLSMFFSFVPIGLWITAFSQELRLVWQHLLV